MFMPIYLSTDIAPQQWGTNSLLSYSAENIFIHFQPENKIEIVQKAARKLDSQGIKKVSLQGNNWDLESCWHFWLGFQSPKTGNQIDWPTTLTVNDKRELELRLDIIGWVREVTNLSAESLSPSELAESVVSLIKNYTKSICYEMICGEVLQQKSYMGIYSVGKSSDREPVLLVLDYNPTNDKSAPVFACLVGKGITFDSGGYSIKNTAFMSSMKSDMGGAALISGALALAIARGLKKRIKLYLCCADNMISGQAMKLGDIISYRNGKQVEVMNTDAEGRLVLADGLIDASAQQPQFIIDCATLTGAAKIALGNDYHALFSFDDVLAEALLSSAAKENEPFWRLPLAEFHRQQIPSAFADISNTASTAHTAGGSTAAAFLSYFVENYQINWIHVDCSAAYRKSSVDKWAVGATGLGVRTLANLLLTLA